MFTKTRFDSLQLPDSIMQGIASLGWECLTEVQRDTIPIARSGQDVIGQARTGSGKTAAFGIPILEALCCGIPVITTKGGCFSEEILEKLNDIIPNNKKYDLIYAFVSIHHSEDPQKIVDNVYNFLK